MTPEQKNMMMWTGIIAGIILLGWIVLDVRKETWSSAHARALGLIAKYDASHPAHGASAETIKRDLDSIQAQQNEQLSQAESALISPLPEQFTNAEISAAEGTVREAINLLEQKAQRQNIPLVDLPYKKAGLDSSIDVRRMQLAHVYLYSGVVDVCIDAGVSSITAVQVMSGGVSDPSETYGLITCNVEVVAKWKGEVNTVLSELLRRQNHKGYGMRSLEIMQNEDGTQRVRLSVSLFTRNEKAWGLKSEGGGKPAVPSSAPVKRSRIITEDA